ncbi:MAG: aldo/keto reductase [Clostridiales bacterium]|nr:aldo/keto reductase [Clostridiales bacterium]
MEKIRLGRTNLMVSRVGFGALPIQRISLEDAGYLLRKAYDNGINFFDTARGYTDSEEKIGYALSDVRSNIIIATKTHANDKKSLFEQLETSLKNMKTDYIDIYQLHNPSELPDPDDPDGVYSGLLEAQKKGMIRFIGITNHRLNLALDAVKSGLYDTIQFPLSSLSSDEDIELVQEADRHDMGFIAMKPLSGGLITRVAPTFAFLRQFDNVVPIWGIQRESELDEFIELEKNPPALDEDMWKTIEQDKKELQGAFCRGCGYCLPCPVDIPIPFAARMSLLLRRAPYQNYLSDEWNEKMERVEDCIDCGHCRDNCPYGLNPPELMKGMLKDYREFRASHI